MGNSEGDSSERLRNLQKTEKNLSGTRSVAFNQVERASWLLHNQKNKQESSQKQRNVKQEPKLGVLKEVAGIINKLRHEIALPLIEKARKDKEYLENQYNANVLRDLTRTNDTRLDVKKVALGSDHNKGKANNVKNGISING